MGREHGLWVDSMSRSSSSSGERLWVGLGGGAGSSGDGGCSEDTSDFVLSVNTTITFFIDCGKRYPAVCERWELIYITYMYLYVHACGLFLCTTTDMSGLPPYYRKMVDMYMYMQLHQWREALIYMYNHLYTLRITIVSVLFQVNANKYNVSHFRGS